MYICTVNKADTAGVVTNAWALLEAPSTILVVSAVSKAAIAAEEKYAARGLNAVVVAAVVMASVAADDEEGECPASLLVPVVPKSHRLAVYSKFEENRRKKKMMIMIVMMMNKTCQTQMKIVCKYERRKRCAR